MRVKSMFEVLAYVPTPPLVVRFLNRTVRISVHRNGEAPVDFLRATFAAIDQAFATRPGGGTPVLEVLQQSFAEGEGRSVARYLFCDGVPNGMNAPAKIIELLKLRANPKGNPITLLSCTNEDDQVEWMKNAEEVAPYASELDDFFDEAKEVARDQGHVFPYTRGFHLIAELVAAMNPDDLDAMDESVPFTKFMLDNLLGVASTDADYRRYFDGFLTAQRTRRIEGPEDRLKKSVNWQPLVGGASALVTFVRVFLHSAHAKLTINMQLRFYSTRSFSSSAVPITLQRWLTSSSG
jgi:hypothetical protein